jgi:hypothetical protein
MTFNQLIFAGVDLSSGRKPVTFTALDRELNVVSRERWSFAETISCLNGYEKILLAITSSSKKSGPMSFQKELTRIGMSAMSENNERRQFVETKAQDCYRMLAGSKLLSSRTFEGRVQRSLILYEEGFQIPDPMDLFEEITRHKLIQGVLPIEDLYSTKELDAFVAAYLAWMTANRPHQVEFTSENFAIPKASDD